MSDIWVYTPHGYMNVEQDDDDEPNTLYTCGECGITFAYPAEDGLRHSCCPECGSTNIDEVMPEWAGELISDQPCCEGCPDRGNCDPAACSKFMQHLGDHEREYLKNGPPAPDIV